MDPNDIFDKDFGSTQQHQEQEDQDNDGSKTLEQELTERYHFKSMKDTKEIYYYDENKGVYLKSGEWLIEQECVTYFLQIKTKDVTDIKNRIIWANYVDRSDFDSKIEWLCCKNVMVNLRSGEVKPHSPEFMATVQIPHDYLCYKTPCVPAPARIMQFFHQVMAFDDVETVLDFIAYCLWRELRFHKLLLFNGSGRNGKGVTTQLITRFLGRHNVSNETLHRILENRFASAKLFGKMANVDADMSSQALKHTGILKMLTGGDDVPAEHKFKPAFSFQNYAKLIFSANVIPQTPDETVAFFARLIIINFPNEFLGDKANPDLIDELATEPEMSALLAMVIRRLSRVLKSGISTSHSSVEDNYVKYIESSDPIRLFAELAIRRTTDGQYETKAHVYASYERFCSDKNVGKESSEAFSRRLKKLGFEEPKQQRLKEGGKAWVWPNIKLRDYTKPDDEDQEVLDNS